MTKMARRVLPLVVCVSALTMLGQGTPQNRRGPARGGAAPAAQQPPAAQTPPARGAAAEEQFVDPRAQKMRELGQTPPASEEAGIPFGRVSIASLDAVNKLLADLEAPTQDPLRKSIEQAPFLGEGTIAGDKPIGILLIAGPNQPLMNPQTAVIAVPMVAGKATPELIKRGGGTEVAGKTDTFTAQNNTLRRTANYLFGREGNSAMGMAALTDTPFANDYKTPGNLFLFTVDLAKLRTGAPNAYKQLGAMGSFIPGLAGGDPNSPNPVQTVLDKIDRLTLALNRDDQNLHLQLWKMPFAVKSGKELPRPAFPAGVLGQMHVVYPDKETSQWAEQQVDAMQDATLPGPPETKAQVRSVLKKFAALHAKSDGFSLAISIKEKTPIIYIVDQFSEDVDAAAELKGMQPDFEAIAKTGQMKTELSTYDLGDKKVQRLAITGAKRDNNAYLDVIQDGKVAYATIAVKDEHFVEKLKAAGMNGKSNVLCAGVLDLGAILQEASSGGGGPLSNLPPDALAQLKTAFAGQGITWTVQGAEGDGNYVYADLAIPFQAAKAVGKVSRQMTGGGAGGGM